MIVHHLHVPWENKEFCFDTIGPQKSKSETFEVTLENKESYLKYVP